MSVFSKKVSENTIERKFVGGNIPQQTYAYITLYSLSQQTAKSKLLADCIEEWKEKAMETLSMADLIAKTASVAISQFEDDTDKKKSVPKFRIKLTAELRKKGIPPEFINPIIAKFNEAQKE